MQTNASRAASASPPQDLLPSRERLVARVVAVHAALLARLVKQHQHLPATLRLLPRLLSTVLSRPLACLRQPASG